MVNRTRRDAFALFALVWLPSARAQRAEVLRDAGITFGTPKGWSVIDIADTEGVMLLPPGKTEASTDAYIFIEEASLIEPEAPRVWLSSFIAKRQKTATDFEEVRRVESKTGRGVSYGLAEYTHVFHGIPSRNWVVIMPRARKLAVVIHAFTTETTAQRYLPVFEWFLQSVSLTK